MAKLGRPFEPMTDVQRKVLMVIDENPNATITQWVEIAGYNTSTFRNVLICLERKGYLRSIKPRLLTYKITEKAREEL